MNSRFSFIIHFFRHCLFLGIEMHIIVQVAAILLMVVLITIAVRVQGIRVFLHVGSLSYVRFRSVLSHNLLGCILITGVIRRIWLLYLLLLFFLDALAVRTHARA